MLLWSVALAQEAVQAEGFVRRELAGRPILELRGGVQTRGLDRPTLCVEGAPLRWLALEACGNGAGIVHQQPTGDMLHVRAKGTFAQAGRGRSSGALQLGVGMTEVQSTRDAPGFVFEAERSAIEAAGGEVSMSAKGRHHLSPGAYVVGDLNIGVAYVPGAPNVFPASGPVLPFASVTVGLGF